MKVSVKVPATSANLGPGFDCLGIALPIYNIVTIEETVLPSTGIEINVISEEDDSEKVSVESIPTDKNNIVYKAVEMLYNLIGQSPSELKITIHSQIPIARGLGSSAAVIVGGLMAANKLLNEPADLDALLSIASEVEGHPDNVVPAVLGGLAMSSMEDDGSIIYRQLDWPEEWHITVCIPDYELATDISRSVLPKEVPMEDATFNARRLGMFVEAVNKKDAELMKYALQDKLHQPYRTKLVPGLQEIMYALKHEENVLGCVLSGAGPSVLVISQKNNLERIREIVREIWTNLNVNVFIKTFSVEKQGAHIVEHHNN